MYEADHWNHSSIAVLISANQQLTELHTAIQDTPLNPDSTVTQPASATTSHPSHDLAASIDRYDDDLHQTSAAAQMRPWDEGHHETHTIDMYRRATVPRRLGALPPPNFDHPPRQTILIEGSASGQENVPSSASTDQSESTTHSHWESKRERDNDDDAIVSDTSVDDEIEKFFSNVYDRVKEEGSKNVYMEQEDERRAEEDKGRVNVDLDVDMHHHDSAGLDCGSTDADAIGEIDPDVGPLDLVNTAAYDAVTVAGNVNIPMSSSSPHLAPLTHSPNVPLESNMIGDVPCTSAGGKDKSAPASPRKQRFKKRKEASSLPSTLPVAFPSTRGKSSITGKMTHVRGTITRQTDAVQALRNKVERKTGTRRAASTSTISSSGSSTAQRGASGSMHLDEDDMPRVVMRVIDHSDFVRRSERRAARTNVATAQRNKGNNLSKPSVPVPRSVVNEVAMVDDSDEVEGDDDDEDVVEEESTTELDSGGNSDDQDFQPSIKVKVG